MGNPISGSGTVTMEGGGTVTLSGANTYTGATTISAGTLEVGIGGSLGTGTVTDNTSLVFNNDTSTVPGSISGPGKVTIEGGGTVTLPGANTYSGGTTISGGTLQIYGSGDTIPMDGPQGTGNIAVGSNASLAFDFNSGYALTVANVISGNGSVTLGGDDTGTLTLSGANTYSGGTTISAGTLQMGSATALGSSTATTNTVTDNGGLAFNLSGTSSVPNVISGTGSVTMEGSGTVTLSGANSYSGGTTISAGTLQMGSPTALGSSPATPTNVTVNGGTLDINMFSETVAELTLVSGSVVGTSGVLTATSDFLVESGEISAILAAGIDVELSKTTSGTVTLSGANTYSGGTMISAGTLQVGSYDALGTGSVTLDGDGTALLATVSASAPPIPNNITVDAPSQDPGNSTLGTIADTTGSGPTVFTGNVTLNTNPTDENPTFNTIFQGGNSAGTTWDGLISSGGEAVNVQVTSAGGTTASTAFGLNGSFTGSASIVGTWPASTSASPVDLSGSYNLTGIVNDGTQFSGGGLDGGGSALSANLLGSQVDWDGQSFNLGQAGLLDVVSATATLSGTGQTIPLAPGSFSQLLLLADAVNGAQTGQTFMVNYTDGTSSSFTQNFSDWASAKGYAGESIAVSMPYRDGSDGGRGAGPFQVYGYSFTLNASKTLESITLPTDANLDILAMDLDTPSLPQVKLSDGAVWSLSSPMIASALSDGTVNMNGGTVYLNGNTLTIGDASNMSSNFSGTIADGSAAGSVVQTGTGTLTLSGADTYSGGTTISQGTLQIGSYDALGTGSVTLNDGNTGDNPTSLLATVSANDPPIPNNITVADLGTGTSILGTMASTAFTASIPSVFTGNVVLDKDATFEGENSAGTTWEGLISSVGSVNVQVTSASGATTTFASTSTIVGSISVDSGATLQTGSPVPLSSSYNLTGIVNDGTSFSGGGIDGKGDDLSANLLGSQVVWDGQSFTMGPAGLPDVVRAAGQTITVAQGNYNELLILADAVNGDQTGLIFTAHYTDGTSSPFTQSFSDWFIPQNYGGESKAVSMPYRDVSNGGTGAGPFYVYGYSFSLNASKTLQSITLPSDSNLNVLAMELVPPSLPQVTVAAGGTWNLSSPTTVSALDDGGTLNLTGGTVNLNGNTLTIGDASNLASSFSGTIADGSAAGSVVKTGTGTLTLTGTDTYSGGTTISQGTLEVGSDDALGSAVVTNDGDLMFTGSDNVTASNNIAGSGELIQDGTGTLTLSGTSTYTGATVVNAGTLAVASNAAVGETSEITVDSDATLDVQASLASSIPVDVRHARDEHEHGGGKDRWSGHR